MKRFVFQRVLVAGLLALLLCIPSLPARASQPESVTIPLDVTAVARNYSRICGYTIVYHIEGFIRMTTHLDQAGNPTVEVDAYHYRGYWTNPANGTTVNFTVAGTYKAIPNPDGSITVIFAGLNGFITVPGQGLVTADLGRFIETIIPGNPEPVIDFEAGISGPDPIVYLCSLLQ